MSLVNAIGSYAAATTMATRLPESFYKQRNLEGYATLVVDMQDSYIKWVADNSSEIIRRQLSVLRFCKDCELPIVFLEMSDSGDTTEELMDLVVGYNRKQRIKKTRRDGFIGTELGATLKRLSISHLIFLFLVFALFMCLLF